MTTCPTCGAPRPTAGDLLAITNGTHADAIDLAHAVVIDSRCPVRIKTTDYGFEVYAR